MSGEFWFRDSDRALLAGRASKLYSVRPMGEPRARASMSPMFTWKPGSRPATMLLCAGPIEREIHVTPYVGTPSDDGYRSITVSEALRAIVARRRKPTLRDRVASAVSLISAAESFMGQASHVVGAIDRVLDQFALLTKSDRTLRGS